MRRSPPERLMTTAKVYRPRGDQDRQPLAADNHDMARRARTIVMPRSSGRSHGTHIITPPQNSIERLPTAGVLLLPPRPPTPARTRAPCPQRCPPSSPLARPADSIVPADATPKAGVKPRLDGSPHRLSAHPAANSSRQSGPSCHPACAGNPVTAKAGYPCEPSRSHP